MLCWSYSRFAHTLVSSPFQIVDYRDRGDLNPEEFCLGLDKGFSEIEGHDIGQFPREATQQESSVQELVTA